MGNSPQRSITNNWTCRYLVFLKWQFGVWNICMINCKIVRFRHTSIEKLLTLPKKVLTKSSIITVEYNWEKTRRHGKLFFLWLVVSKGTIWDLFRQNRCILKMLLLYTTGFEKFFDPWPILLFISQTKYLTHLVLLTFLFLMILLGTIWYTARHYSCILRFWKTPSIRTIKSRVIPWKSDGHELAPQSQEYTESSHKNVLLFYTIYHVSSVLCPVWNFQVPITLQCRAHQRQQQRPLWCPVICW